MSISHSPIACTCSLFSIQTFRASFVLTTFRSWLIQNTTCHKLSLVIACCLFSHAKIWKPDVKQHKQGVLVLMPARSQSQTYVYIYHTTIPCLHLHWAAHMAPMNDSGSAVVLKWYHVGSQRVDEFLLLHEGGGRVPWPRPGHGRNQDLWLARPLSLRPRANLSRCRPQGQEVNRACPWQSQGLKPAIHTSTPIPVDLKFDAEARWMQWMTRITSLPIAGWNGQRVLRCEWPQVAAFGEWLQVAAFLNSTPNATPLGCLVKGWSPARWITW